MPPKSKRREALRGKILETRGGARGRPLDPPRNEKVILERERVRGIAMVTKANTILERGLDGKEPTQAEIECARQTLDRYGHPRKTHVETLHEDPYEVFLMRVAPGVLPEVSR